MINHLDIDEADLDELVVAAIGLEESGDLARAIALYKIGSSLGHLISMTRLANLLSEPPAYLNVPLAEQLYKRACVAGHAAGCRNLAIMYKQLGKTELHDRYMKLAKVRGDVWQMDD